MTLDLARFELLSFDCYGTLIDWESGIVNALSPWLARHRQMRSRDAMLESFGAVEGPIQDANPAMLYPKILAASHRALARRWAIDADEAAARAFGASVGDWPAFSDSHAALARLKRRRKLVILSNVDRESFARSNVRLGIAFDRICTAQDIGSYKPDPRNFAYLHEAVRAMGVAADRHLHVAQSLFHDIAPARAAGLATVWINRRRDQAGGGATPASTARPDLELGSLAELADRLDSLSG
jgi:2-haloalkanoic acid dehalogenase type II